MRRSVARAAASKLVNTAIRSPDRATPGDPVTFDVEDENGPKEACRVLHAGVLSGGVRPPLPRTATGVDFPVERVTFVHRAPESVTEHERVFGGPVAFEASHNRLTLARRVWGDPHRRGRAGGAPAAPPSTPICCSRTLPKGTRPGRASAPRDRRAPARRRLVARGVAREVGMSERSLQRHLREHGYSYQALADEVRAATARPLPRAARHRDRRGRYLLGFADPSTFHRAFKRWTGIHTGAGPIGTSRGSRKRGSVVGSRRADPRGVFASATGPEWTSIAEDLDQVPRGATNLSRPDLPSSAARWRPRGDGR